LAHAAPHGTLPRPIRVDVDAVGLAALRVRRTDVDAPEHRAVVAQAAWPERTTARRHAPLLEDADEARHGVDRDARRRETHGARGQQCLIVARLPAELV